MNQAHSVLSKKPLGANSLTAYTQAHTGKGKGLEFSYPPRLGAVMAERQERKQVLYFFQGSYAYCF